MLAFGDVGALPVLGDVFDAQHLPASEQTWVLCGAYSLAAGDTAAWDALVADSAGWTTLVPAAAEVLSNPTACTE